MWFNIEEIKGWAANGGRRTKKVGMNPADIGDFLGKDGWVDGNKVQKFFENDGSAISAMILTITFGMYINNIMLELWDMKFLLNKHESIQLLDKSQGDEQQ